MTAHAHSIERIRQIAITVSDLVRATAFYRDVLELPFLFTAAGMAFFECGGVRLMLALPEESVPVAASILYYQVADIAAAHSRLVERGVEFEGEPHIVHRAETHDMWLAFFRDSERNLLALLSEVER
jgi:predicted enzyme related to lactoylglutathione lyase